MRACAVVVLTRDAAAKSIAAGDELVSEFKQLVSQTPSDASLKALSVLNKRVGDSNIPLTMKNTLRDDIDASIKTFNAAIKAQSASLKTDATAYGAALAAENNAPFVVITVDKFGADRELLQAVADGYSGVKADVGLFVLGVDSGKDKALAVVSMPAAFVAKGLAR